MKQSKTWLVALKLIRSYFEDVQAHAVYTFLSISESIREKSNLKHHIL